MSKPVFSRARKELALAVLAAAGAASALTACSSDEATYRPQPSSTQPATRSCGSKCGASTTAPRTYTQPSTTYTQPAQPATKPGGQMSCGKGGKCG